MYLKNQIIFFLIILLASSSCNKSDENENHELRISNIIFSEISATSSTVNWDINTSESEVLYSIYLDNDLIEENLDETNFTFTNLIPNKIYNVKIKAVNEFSSTEAEAEFTTIDDDLIISNLIISEISATSSRVDWDIINTSETEVLYSIYLNNVLIVENLSETNFSFVNLVPNTIYTVKIKADNEFSSTEAETEFTTINDELLLSKYTYRSNFVEFIYDNNFNLERKNTNFGQLYSTYSYNNDGTIREVVNFRFDCGSLSSYANYFYSNGSLNSLNLKEFDADCFQGGWAYERFNDFSFNAGLDSYTRVQTHKFYNNSGTLMLTEINNYTVTVGYNSDGKVISISEVDNDSSIQQVYNFEYLDGNLTKINLNGQILDIIYDDKKSFHTYDSGYGHYIYGHLKEKDAVGLLLLEENITSTLRRLPLLFNNRNKNNPLEYRLNGNQILTFTYEYNSLNYPIKITTSNQDEIFLEYYE